jgi:hydroxymethylpyrimidine kinase/phosphomethylpyrimidine kinase
LEFANVDFYMVSATKQPVVMTIAGFDPSGGAGVLADIKTISSLGCYGVAAITSLTVQNTQQVFGALHHDAATVRGQIEALIDDFEIAAIKTGMLPTAEIVFEVARTIGPEVASIVVVDPVLTSTSAFDLCDERAVDALTRSLFPLATLVTPNIAEAARITGADIYDDATMHHAAETILRMGPGAVLITGGDAGSDTSLDFLLDVEGASTYCAERVSSTNTHGTGCTFASAIACLLARGHSLREAIPLAKQYVSDAILGAPGLGHGHGPLNHFSRWFER